MLPGINNWFSKTAKTILSSFEKWRHKIKSKAIGWFEHHELHRYHSHYGMLQHTRTPALDYMESKQQHVQSEEEREKSVEGHDMHWQMAVASCPLELTPPPTWFFSTLAGMKGERKHLKCAKNFSNSARTWPIFKKFCGSQFVRQ